MSSSSSPELNPMLTSLDGIFSSLCFIVAALIIAVPKLITSCKKKNQLDLKIKHLSNLINLESERNSIEQSPSPNAVIIEMKDLKEGKKRYSLATVEGLGENTV